MRCKCFTCEYHDGDDCQDFYMLAQIDAGGDCENCQHRGTGSEDENEAV